jgi:DNA repair protein RadC
VANEDRKLGIDILGALPWGKHLCYFYNTKQDLIDTLVPYFKAGLENNEFCIWITSESLSVKEAEEAMGKAIPDFSQYLAREQIEIIPHTDWYLKGDIFNGKRVLNAWLDKLERAMASGYDGMRVTGDTAWLEKKDRNKFTDYEKEVNNAIGKYHFLAFCTYPLDKFGASQTIDIINNHQYNLIRRKGVLTYLAGTELEQAEAKQKITENTSLDGFWIADGEGRLLEVNDSCCKMLGYTREELLKMSVQDIDAVESPEDALQHIKKIREQGFDLFKTQQRRKDGKIIDVEVNVNYLDAGGGQEFAFLRDITALKHAEERRGLLLRNKPERHLAQLQQRFIRSGFEGFEDKDIIELLLSLALPVQKAKQLAKACMEQFKNLRDFLAAPPEELQQTGITPACMFCIKLLHELPVKVLKQRIVARSIYKSSKEVFDYLYYSMRDLKKEVFKVIYLNNRSQIIDTVDLFEGTVDNIPIRPREIIESALTQGAKALIFVHNHPTGDPIPSHSDKQLTRDLVFVGNILQIKVLDHIIIGGDSYFSFADEGFIQKYDDNFFNLKIQGMRFGSLPNVHHHRHQISA